MGMRPVQQKPFFVVTFEEKIRLFSSFFDMFYQMIQNSKHKIGPNEHFSQFFLHKNTYSLVSEHSASISLLIF